ncbi:MAG TPA: universal stress protein [Microlunatus sp.]|nr:universal stress protein [Microlunatus sp.]
MMSHTVQHDGIAVEQPELRSGFVVVGVSTAFPAHDRSIPAASEWAARRRADLKLVVGLDPTDAEDDPRPRFALAEIDRVADHLALKLDPSQRIATSVSHHSAVDTLVAESSAAGLVVVQRRRMGPWARLRAGSTSGVVAARADSPVLIMHGDDPVPDPLGDRAGVLVGVDGRGHAGRAIAEAFDEASWRGVPLTAAIVWTPLESTYVPPDVTELEFGTSSTAVTLSEQLAGYRDRYPDVALHEIVLSGEPEPALVELSRDHGLLVVARHTEGRHGQRNLGSTTRRIIEEARCPVLVTPTARPASVARRRQPKHE